MKTSITVVLFGLGITLSRGSMSDQLHDPHSQKWVTIKNKESGLKVDFPLTPLEMSFDIPFQNTPPEGQIHVYSLPTQKGLLVLSTFHSLKMDSKELTKEKLLQFFETILVPHFFYNPSIFHDHQDFKFKSVHSENGESASFQISFLDHGIEKRLEGIALIKNQTLYIPFYLASDMDFDQTVFDRFLGSVQL